MMLPVRLNGPHLERALASSIDRCRAVRGHEGLLGALRKLGLARLKWYRFIFQAFAPYLMHDFCIRRCFARSRQSGMRCRMWYRPNTATS
jgi:hypothetical protein